MRREWCLIFALIFRFLYAFSSLGMFAEALTGIEDISGCDQMVDDEIVCLRHHHFFPYRSSTLRFPVRRQFIHLIQVDCHCFQFANFFSLSHSWNRNNFREWKCADSHHAFVWVSVGFFLLCSRFLWMTEVNLSFESDYPIRRQQLELFGKLRLATSCDLPLNSK